MNTKELTNLAKEHRAKIVSFEPFCAIVSAKKETHKIYENGIERVKIVDIPETTFSDEYKFRDFCRDEVYADVYRTVHNGWNAG